MIRSFHSCESGELPKFKINLHIYIHTGRGGGTGLIISNNWKFTPLSSLSINSSFESHSVTITYPLIIIFAVVYRPPGRFIVLFDLKRVLTTATHKSGNQLELIYTLHCSPDHVLVTPLHTSDHFLLTLILNMIPDTSHTPSHVTFRHNLCSLSLSRLWFHICFLPLNIYHILMLTVLLTLSVPL